MEHELNDDLYVRFREWLRTRYGFDYPERKRTDLNHSLNLALASCGAANLAALYAEALAGGPAAEAILAQVTIGETFFFRNLAQFEVLRHTILPELMERRHRLQSLRLWSAGCATGEEPYSLAMLLTDVLPTHNEWQASILATDINPHFLARAREASYGAWSFREMPPGMRERFFSEEKGRWQLCPEIRRMVTFARLNLAEPTYPAIMNGTCAMDVIVCRNVTIYFDEATTRQVIERFFGALSPGGWLIVGHAEPQASTYRKFETHNFPDTVIYRKPLDAPLFAFDPTQGTFSAGRDPVLYPKLASREPPPRPVVHPAMPDERSEVASTISASPPEAKPPTRTPGPLATDLWPAVRLRSASGDKDGVEKLLREILEADPGNVEALMTLARLCADRGNWEGAETSCTLALSADPLLVNAHYLLGQIYEHQNRLDAALAAYRSSVFLDRNFVLGTLAMANVWRQMGHIADARRAYRSALRQLSTLPATTRFREADGATSNDLIALATHQIQSLDHR